MRYQLLLILFGLLFSMYSMAEARLRLVGTVQIYNPITQQYEPATGMRLRAVMWEYVDGDTADVETTVASDGGYSMTKNGPWVADGYGVQLLAFAENSGVFEVQSHYMQYDGYQALSAPYYAPDGRETECSLRIGGPRSTVSRYQVGGVSGWFADTVDTHLGVNAFFLFREASSFRYDLVARAFAKSQFEEKEITFAMDAPDGRYTSFLDYVLIFSGQSDRDLANTIRHELGHAVMADVYPGYGVFSGGPTTHYLHSEETAKFAWTEGWAEFLAEATRRMRYHPGPPSFTTDVEQWGNDLETTDAPWTRQVRPTAVGQHVEGHVAAALYDLYDGTGWEKRRVQIPEVPGDEQFWEGVSDPDFRRIEQIVTAYHPYSFLGGSNPQDSLLAYWFKSPSYGLDHEVKAICYNRQMTLDALPNKPMPERAPSVQIADASWQHGNQLQVRCTVGDPDPEDRQYLWLELYLNDRLAQRVRLSDAALWANRTSCDYTFSQEVAWAVGDPQPKILVHVHDDMLSAMQVRTVTPPPATTITELQVEVLGVTWRNNLTQPGESFVVRDARAGVDVFDASGAKVTGAMYLQPAKSQPGWQIHPATDFTSTQSMMAETVTGPGNELQINFYAEASYLGSGQTYRPRKSVVLTFSRAENYGLGMRTALIPLVDAPNFTLTCEIAYRISSTTQPSPPVSQFFPVTLAVAPLNLRARTNAGVEPSLAALIQRTRTVEEKQYYLEVRLLELEEELELKLDTAKAPVKTGGRPPLDPKFVKSSQRLIPNGVNVIRGQRASVSASPFLQRAASGVGLPTTLSANGKVRVQEIQQEIEAISKQLITLRDTAQHTQRDLNAVETALNNAANLTAAEKNAKRQALVRARDVLTTVQHAETTLQAGIKQNLSVLLLLQTSPAPTGTTGKPK